MSINCWLLGLTPAQIAALRAAPSLARDVTVASASAGHQALIDEIVRGMTPEQRAQYEANQAAFEANPAVAEARAFTAKARERAAPLGPFEEALGLEKSWHMLHYLLTGHLHPVGGPGEVLMTGEEVGEDAGYGPARLHGPEDTRAFSRFLEAQDVGRLQARVSYQEMSRLGVYAMPGGPASEAEFEADVRAVVGISFPRLRDYVHRMADKGNGLLVWLS